MAAAFVLFIGPAVVAAVLADILVVVEEAVLIFSVIVMNQDLLAPVAQEVAVVAGVVAHHQYTTQCLALAV
jgi:hypothetical protein